jgi:hypothetical protein
MSRMIKSPVKTPAIKIHGIYLELSVMNMFMKKKEKICRKDLNYTIKGVPSL